MSFEMSLKLTGDGSLLMLAEVERNGLRKRRINRCVKFSLFILIPILPSNVFVWFLILQVH